MISRSAGRLSRFFRIWATGLAALGPRMIASGGIRMEPGVRWLIAGYLSELVTSSGTAAPESNLAFAVAGSTRGARIIIGGAREALPAAARAAPRPSGEPGWRIARDSACLGSTGRARRPTSRPPPYA